MSGPYDFLPDGNFEAMAGNGICDFCVPAQPAPWIYPCKSFDYPTPKGFPRPKKVMRSNGGWGACVVCADLIEQGNQSALVDRCTKVSEHPVLRDVQTRLVKRFFENRIDEPRKYVGTYDSEYFDGVTVIVPEKK